MTKLRIEQGGETEEFQEQVFTADKAGERLDVFCARVSDNTRSAVQRMILNGDVTLNGAPAKSKDKLRAGDTVAIAFRPPEEVDIVPQDIPIDSLRRCGHSGNRQAQGNGGASGPRQSQRHAGKRPAMALRRLSLRHRRRKTARHCPPD